MLEGLSRWLSAKPVHPVNAIDAGFLSAAETSGGELAGEPGCGDMPGDRNLHAPSPDETVPDEEQQRFRPTVGLALGGGAARGWAHIGVIRALEEAGIRPDIVTGTSIGAVIGGCYLAGKLDNVEAFARRLTRRQMLGLLDFSLGGSGLISGSRLMRLLERDIGDLAIEDLDCAFTSVATELGTGHEIWLRSGSLIEAMRASYALPGIFQPVQIGGRWLVDGALVNPIPVSVCRALGARVVIAVNLNADVFGRGTTVVHALPPAPANELPGSEPETPDSGSRIVRLLRRQFFGRDDGLPGISGVMMEAFNIIQDRIGRSRLAGDPPDVLIGPKLGHLGLFDFHRAEEAISIGYEHGRKMTEEVADHIAALA